VSTVGGETGDSEPPEPRRRRRSSADSIPLPASSGRITTELVGPPLRLPDESTDSLSIDLDAADRDSDTDLPLDPPESEEHRSSSELGSIAPPANEGALGLVERSRSTSSGLDLVAEMRERFELDDYTGALRASELVLGRTPDHEEAQRISEASRGRLELHYLTRLGSLESRPRVVVKAAEIRWLGLDHRAGFLLSRIDGSASIDDLLAVSGMARLETLKTLVDLLYSEAIEID